MFVLTFLSSLCFAHAHNADECVEGGDFIRNAAFARDRGVTEADFISGVHDDIEAVKVLPPDLRWFVRDDDDAQFLLSAATEVFRNPKEAHAHRADFIAACMRRGKDK